jgi:uncharacterized protein (TIGR00290 family)
MAAAEGEPAPSGSSEGLPKALVSWSSGKDAAFALHEARRRGEVEVVGLITTVTAAFGRISMHGVREELLERQARAVGLPCRKIEIPYPCPNEVYERAMARVIDEAKAAGVRRIVFGDLFLEDIRAYREQRLAPTGIAAMFPLWRRDTARLAREMIAAGIRATLVCIDPKKLDTSFAGRTFDSELLWDLPAGVDPCGENGEFHTFVTEGPMFREPVRVVPGPVVERDGFVFADLRPA